MKSIVAIAILTGCIQAAEHGPDPVQLVAPIFPQIGGLDSRLYFALVSDKEYPRATPDDILIPGIHIEEYQETYGDPARGCGVDHAPDSNHVMFHHGVLDLTVGTCTENGFLLVRFRGDREIHAYVKTWHEDFPDDPFLTQAVRPAAAFRLIVEGQMTGIAIVNPTDSDQKVTVKFYQSNSDSLKMRESVLTIKRWSKVSRFLSELFDLEGLDLPWGVVRIQGETEIAVAAVQISSKTQRFQTILVSAEPDRIIGNPVRNR